MWLVLLRFSQVLADRFSTSNLLGQSSETSETNLTSRQLEWRDKQPDRTKNDGCRIFTNAIMEKHVRPMENAVLKRTKCNKRYRSPFLCFFAQHSGAVSSLPFYCFIPKHSRSLFRPIVFDFQIKSGCTLLCFAIFLIFFT